MNSSLLKQAEENFIRFPKVYPTVDIAVLNEFGELLLCKKPKENFFRFPGGFVDPSDISFEFAAARELKEETNINVDFNNLIYVLSTKVPDPRYEGTRDCITTTLFLTSIQKDFGVIKPKDDIESLQWHYLKDLVEEDFMPVHRAMFQKFINSKHISK